MIKKAVGIIVVLSLFFIWVQWLGFVYEVEKEWKMEETGCSISLKDAEDFADIEPEELLGQTTIREEVETKNIFFRRTRTTVIETDAKVEFFIVPKEYLMDNNQTIEEIESKKASELIVKFSTLEKYKLVNSEYKIKDLKIGASYYLLCFPLKEDFPWKRQHFEFETVEVEGEIRANPQVLYLERKVQKNEN